VAIIFVPLVGQNCSNWSKAVLKNLGHHFVGFDAVTSIKYTGWMHGTYPDCESSSLVEAEKTT